MLKTSINAGSGNIGGKGIDNLVKLQEIYADAPARIAAANEIAAQMTVDEVTRNIRSRGNPGKFIEVTWRKYGELGMQISIGPGRMSGPGGSGGSTRGYNAEIAAKIFLDSEMGKIGRASFTLKNRSGGYVVSHSSGPWTEGRWLQGPMHIPEIGAYYFSRKTGVESIPIKKYAHDIMVKNLNSRYKHVLRLSGRGIR